MYKDKNIYLHKKIFQPIKIYIDKNIYLYKNFAACLHFVTSSDLLFNKKCLSAFKISIFSIVHKLHELPPLMYGLACLRIDH